MDDYVDGYCERIEPGFWAEPLNAWSNLAFLIAAVAVWVAAGRTSGGVRALGMLIALIFAGSAAFHTTATGWGAAADTGFIAVFLLYYVVLFTHLFAGVRRRWAWLAAPAFLGFTALVAAAGWSAGPGLYLPALLVLAGITVALARSPRADLRPHWRRFATATGVFAVSLTLRTLDPIVCDALPIGTHFLWHVLNAVTLYLVSRAAITRWRQLHGTTPNGGT